MAKGSGQGGGGGAGNNKAPTSVSLSSTMLVENTAGAQVGVLTGIDPNNKDTLTFSVDDSRFDVVLNAQGQWILELKPGVTLDYEMTPNVGINVTATDTGGLTRVQAFTISVTNINDAPTDITRTSAGVDENAAAGTVVATLGAADQDAGSTFTYALVAGDGLNDVDNGLVTIVGNEIRVKSGAVIDYETNPVLNLNLRVTDNGGLSYVEAVMLDVLDLREGPELVSVSSAGEQANRDSNSPAISADGRYVAYASPASNLVGNDGGIFVYDRETHTTERVSVSSTGQAANSGTHQPSISAEGRYVVYQSDAWNLVADDTNGWTRDIFVYDRETHTTELVSVSSSGEQGNSTSWDPSISANGRYVTYQSLASNLVAGDTNNPEAWDIFVYDRETRVTELVSVSSTGEQGNHGSGHASLSADGRYVTYSSSATNLVSGDTNGTSDIFVYDREAHTTERVSVSSTGQQGNDDSGWAAISADGRYVTYQSSASNLVAGDTNGIQDVFVYDREAHTTERVSVSSTGQQGNGSSSNASISADGRYVAYTSAASNLVEGDSNGLADVFVFDRQTHVTSRLSVASDGTEANGASFSSGDPAISADGLYVIYQSDASNLVGWDANGFTDIFVASTHELLL